MAPGTAANPVPGFDCPSTGDSLPEILTPTVTPIANIKNIKLIFFIQFLREDSPSESAAQPNSPFAVVKKKWPVWASAFFFDFVGRWDARAWLAAGSLKGVPTYGKTFCEGGR